MDWTEARLVELLNSNDRAVERAILFLYSKQTEDEQWAETARHDNGQGFSSADAPRGSYYARWILGQDRSGNQRYPARRLTGRHLQRARQLVLKYRRQLLAEANRKAATPETPETGPRWTEECPCCIYIGRSGRWDFYFPATGDSAVARWGNDGQVSTIPNRFLGLNPVPWERAWMAAYQKYAKRLDKATKVWALYVDQKGRPEGTTARGIFDSIKTKIEAEA